MNLLNQFPEIDSFFKQDTFSKKNLDNLIQFIEEIYTDRASLKTAEMLIKLELLKFELQGYSNMDKIQQNIKVKHSGEKTKRKERINKADIVPKQINLLSIKLKWDKDYLLKVLKQNKIYKSENDTLTVDEYFLIKPLIRARLDAIRREQDREEKYEGSRISQRNKWKSSEAPGVYGILESYGLGKLIYIRSK